MSRYNRGEYNRSVRLKGPHGEVEIKAHDAEVKDYPAGANIKSMMETALDAYRKMEQQETIEIRLGKSQGIETGGYESATQRKKTP